MSTKYRTRGLSFLDYDAILPVEVERETEHCLWIEGRKCNKVSSWENYHATWEQARAYLFAEAEANIANVRRQLEHAQALAVKVKGIKKPETA